MITPNEINEQDAEPRPPYTEETLYREVVDRIRAHLRSGQQPSRALAMELRRMVIRGILAETIETGASACPRGLGRFKLVRLPKVRRKLLSGEVKLIDRERLRIKLVMGSVLKEKLGYKGYYKYKKKGAPAVDPLAGIHPRKA